MIKPRQEDFDLPADFDWPASKGKIASRETWVGFLSTVLGLAAGTSAFLVAPVYLVRVLGDWAVILLMPLFVGGIAGGTWLAQRILTPLIVGDARLRAKAFGAAVEEWEYHQLETGLGFWTGQRGVDFERALAKLFNARGCHATMTKATGDGGVDLILNVGSLTFWCQCKGQANPVSVAVVREIAGVCSRNNHVPLVFAVNGFTRPAIEAADALGVVLFDSHKIVGIAEKDSLINL